MSKTKRVNLVTGETYIYSKCLEPCWVCGRAVTGEEAEKPEPLCQSCARFREERTDTDTDTDTKAGEGGPCT